MLGGGGGFRPPLAWIGLKTLIVTIRFKNDALFPGHPLHSEIDNSIKKDFKWWIVKWWTFLAW
jgi:hypothetical protein